MSGISDPFIRRPIGATLFAIGLFLLGAVAYFALPVASIPNVEVPAIMVNASRPGADPATMAASVAAPLERALGSISGVTEITSSSGLGSSRIQLIFDLNRNIDSAARDVQAALNAAITDLPGDLPTLPAFRKANPSAQPVLILALTSDTLPPDQVFDVADTLIAQRISQVRGVAQVTINGAEQPAIRVTIDPARIAAIGIGVDDVRNAIINANTSSQLGSFDGARQSLAIETSGQLNSIADYENVIVRSRNGGVTRIGDIATVTRGVRNTRAAGWYAGKPAVLVQVTKQPDANVIETVDGVRDILPDIQRWTPKGIDFNVMSDRTITIRSSVRDLQRSLAISIGLVMLVVFLFLRRAAPTLAVHDRQSVAHGDHRFGRIRRRRRHRDDRECSPEHGEWRATLAGGPGRRPTNRLHRRVDKPVADRRLHSHAVHAGRSRSPAAHVLADHRLRHRRLGDHLAVHHADDLRSLHEVRNRGGSLALRSDR